MIKEMLFGSQDQESVRLMRVELVRIERKIDLLLKHSGLVYDPYADFSEPVAAAMRAGRKIEAIKLYREETGADIREAKEYIESLAD